MDVRQFISARSGGRHTNRHRVLSEMRSGAPIGRSDIARKLALSVQAVSNMTDDLLKSGLIRLTGHRSGGRGLPVALYELNPDGAFALGFEVRPQALYATLTDVTGAIRGQERLPLTSSQPRWVLPRMQELATSLCRSEDVRTRLLGAGVVRPGPFGRTGLHAWGTELEGWDDDGLSARIEDTLGIFVIEDNDATAGASAEHISGCGQGVSDFAYLYFGMGLGMGIIANNLPLRGAHGNSGEIGQLRLPGIPGVLEDHLSRAALARVLAARGLDGDSVDALQRHYEAQEPVIMNWISSAAEALGVTVALIENLYDPATIVLGGAMPPALLDAVIAACPLPQATVANRPERKLPRLQRGACGPFTVSTGAAALIRNFFLSTQM